LRFREAGRPGRTIKIWKRISNYVAKHINVSMLGTFYSAPPAFLSDIVYMLRAILQACVKHVTSNIQISVVGVMLRAMLLATSNITSHSPSSLRHNTPTTHVACNIRHQKPSSLLPSRRNTQHHTSATLKVNISTSKINVCNIKNMLKMLIAIHKK
jgi:hypothetical protein